MTDVNMDTDTCTNVIAYTHVYACIICVYVCMYVFT